MNNFLGLSVMENFELLHLRLVKLIIDSQPKANSITYDAVDKSKYLEISWVVSKLIIDLDFEQQAVFNADIQ